MTSPTDLLNVEPSSFITYIPLPIVRQQQHDTTTPHNTTPHNTTPHNTTPNNTSDCSTNVSLPSISAEVAYLISLSPTTSSCSPAIQQLPSNLFVDKQFISSLTPVSWAGVGQLLAIAVCAIRPTPNNSKHGMMTGNLSVGGALAVICLWVRFLPNESKTVEESVRMEEQKSKEMYCMEEERKHEDRMLRHKRKEEERRGEELLRHRRTKHNRCYEADQQFRNDSKEEEQHQIYSVVVCADQETERKRIQDKIKQLTRSSSCCNIRVVVVPSTAAQWRAVSVVIIPHHENINKNNHTLVCGLAASCRIMREKALDKLIQQLQPDPDGTRNVMKKS
eukprot:GHVS01010402.1.p1 GENE.GHVS01010402.1~~GHVS01010402.1.p1  ORF type:complete len:369 (+),score=106.83 GHVS01010402.1:105-1109(+)